MLHCFCRLPFLAPPYPDLHSLLSCSLSHCYWFVSLPRSPALHHSLSSWLSRSVIIGYHVDRSVIIGSPINFLSASINNPCYLHRPPINLTRIDDQICQHRSPVSMDQHIYLPSQSLEAYQLQSPSLSALSTNQVCLHRSPSVEHAKSVKAAYRHPCKHIRIDHRAYTCTLLQSASIIEHTREKEIDDVVEDGDEDAYEEYDDDDDDDDCVLSFNRDSRAWMQYLFRSYNMRMWTEL